MTRPLDAGTPPAVPCAATWSVPGSRRWVRAHRSDPIVPEEVAAFERLSPARLERLLRRLERSVRAAASPAPGRSPAGRAGPDTWCPQGRADALDALVWASVVRLAGLQA